MINVNYGIGTKFIRKQFVHSKYKNERIETITDILKTYNSKNELVNVEYITKSKMTCGQIVKGTALNTTVALGEIV